MAEEIEKCNLNNILYLENSYNIQTEFKDDSCYVDVLETSISATEIDTEDDIKIENGISPNEIKIEFENNLFYCDHCHEHYEDYCTKCRMLGHILNGITWSVTDDRAMQGIPNNILEIKESSGHVGVFALKVLPESVKIGPFNGLHTSECHWKLKGGKFIVTEDKSKVLNWMQYINPARNIYQQNLVPFQHEDNLYYQSNRKILVGEELLVYFGEEYEDSVNKDIEMAFIAPREDDVRDVFACTSCCLGFSTRKYLAKHKSTCPNETNRRFTMDELTQCPFCKIYFYEKEYLENHMPYCCEKIVSKCIPMALDNQTVIVNRRKTKQLQMYKCTQCKYKTSYKSIIRSHLNKHYAVKMYRCEICSGQFKTKTFLELHVKYRHIDVDGKQDKMLCLGDYRKANTKARSSQVYCYSQDKTQQPPKCKLKTKFKYYLQTQMKAKHVKNFGYKCEMCDYKSNQKSTLETHIKLKHLKQFSYECEICDYKANQKLSLKTHVKTKHLKQFSYECEICEYKTNKKANLETHVKSKHLKQFSYECEICDYKTNHKQNIETHVKSKHLKQFSYKCGICDYKTNQKSSLELHVKTKHLKQFRYECEICDYKTNKKLNLETHIKRKHFKQFIYECEKCDYKTNHRQESEKHTKSKHLKQFSYECKICDYKTIQKLSLEIHVKAKHLKVFDYKCEICEYKTKFKAYYERHNKTHLENLNYKCKFCEYRTHTETLLEGHTKREHLEEFNSERELCESKANLKSLLQNRMKTVFVTQMRNKLQGMLGSSHEKNTPLETPHTNF